VERKHWRCIIPYIKKEDRLRLEKGRPENAGQLNYTFSIMVIKGNIGPEKIRQIMDNYIKDKGLCYQNCNDIFGAITGCAYEMYSRFGDKYEKEIEILGDALDAFYAEVVADYEILKCNENGDII